MEQTWNMKNHSISIKAIRNNQRSRDIGHWSINGINPNLDNDSVIDQIYRGLIKSNMGQCIDSIIKREQMRFDKALEKPS